MSRAPRRTPSSFGTYLVQALDARGQLLKQGLRKPVTLRLHYGNRAGAVDLAHSYAVLSRPLPVGTNIAPAPALAALPAAASAKSGLVGPDEHAGLGRSVDRATAWHRSLQPQ